MELYAEVKRNGEVYMDMERSQRHQKKKKKENQDAEQCVFHYTTCISIIL